MADSKMDQLAGDRSTQSLSGAPGNEFSQLEQTWAFDNFPLGARQLLSVIALLDPDSIAEEILTIAPQDTLAGFPQTKPVFLQDL